MAELDTYPKYLLRNSQTWADKVAIRRKRMGIWQGYTWKEFYLQSKYAGLGLLSIGLRKGDKVALVGDDEPEGLWAELAVLAAGGAVAPLWSDSLSSELTHIVNHSDARFVIAEDQEQVDKFLEIRDRIPGVEKIIYWDSKGMRKYDDPFLMSFEQLREAGERYEETAPGMFEKLIAEGRGEDVAAICYTSGATGSLPKGAIITNKAAIHSAQTMCEFVNLNAGDDAFTTFASASILHYWFLGCGFLRGAVINMPEEPETILQDYREIAPKFLLFAPRNWQSLVSNTKVRVNDGGRFKRGAFNFFLNIGYKVAERVHAGNGVPVHLRLLSKLGDSLVYGPLRDKLGLINARYPVTAGSYLSPDFFKFYRAIGLNLLQCYGCTEAGMVCGHTLSDINIESVGRVGSDVQVKVAENSELLVGGAGIFSGYYKDEEETARTLKEGWFHTDDAGRVDGDGHVYYHDRLSHLERLDNGSRYAPASIEGKLQFSEYIMYAMVVGGRDRGFTSAIITMDFDSIAKWAEEKHLAYNSFVDLSQNDDIAELLKKDIQKVNKTLPAGTNLKKFVLLHKQFDPDDAELTRTRKLRRLYLKESYRELIEAIYDGKNEMPVVAQVKYRDGRTGEVKTNIKIRSVD